jgi:micrococcal nuclease
LVAKTSDGAGNISWTWIVGSRTTPGQWPIYVTCGSASDQTYINVT